MKLRRLAFPLVLALILVGMSWLMVTNYQQVDQLRSEGKDPVTIATPGAAGKDGLPGASGERGEQGEPGPVGSPGSDGADGEPGKDGRDGAQGAVGPSGLAGAPGASIKGDTGAPGPTGPVGAQGVPGVAGAPGRTPVISCVQRASNNASINYIAWRYEDEPSSAYRNLYRLPVWAQAEGCVDLRGV